MTLRKLAPIFCAVVFVSFCGGAGNGDRTANVNHLQRLLVRQFPVPEGAVKLRLEDAVPANNASGKARDLSEPIRMMFGPGRLIYVSDNQRHSIFAVGEAGNIIRQIGGLSSGPNEFVSPSYLEEVSDGNIAVLDSAELKVMIMDSLGNSIKAFRVFRPCLSMSSSHKGFLYFSFFNGEQAAPLIDVLDETGLNIGRMGTRLIGNSPLFNSVDICADEDGIFVAWKTVPLVRRYSTSGELIFEHTLDYGPLRKYGELNRTSRPTKNGVEFMNVIWKIRAAKGFYYLLIGYPRIEILKVDYLGQINSVYWDDVPEDFITSDFLVMEESEGATLFVLEARPIPRVRHYHVSESDWRSQVHLNDRR